MSIHKDHRQRVKEHFKTEGLDGFSDHQVLELLLFYCIPRRDTNEIAHNLINRFGTLSNVLDAPVKELEKVDGMGENAAVFINLLKELTRYYGINQVKNVEILRTINDCGRYLVPFFRNLKNEAVYLLCLDAKCKVLSCREVSKGSINATEISLRKIIEIAMADNATSVILAHNHPSGLAVPSPDDVSTTVKIAHALKLVDVVLCDHIVVADEEFVSFVQSDKFDPKLDYSRI